MSEHGHSIWLDILTRSFGGIGENNALSRYLQVALDSLVDKMDHILRINEESKKLDFGYCDWSFVQEIDENGKRLKKLEFSI